MKHLHEKRRVTFQELGAVLGTRELLKLGLLEHDANTSCPIADKHLFNMGTAFRNNQDCGTLACIGGSMGWLMGMSADDARNYVGNARWNHGDHSEALRPLFFPPHDTNSGYIYWESITTEQAVQGIDNWLDTGNPDWESVMFPKGNPKVASAALEVKINRSVAKTGEIGTLRKKPAKRKKAKK